MEEGATTSVGVFGLDGNVVSVWDLSLIEEGATTLVGTVCPVIQMGSRVWVLSLAAEGTTVLLVGALTACALTALEPENKENMVPNSNDIEEKNLRLIFCTMERPLS